MKDKIRWFFLGEQEDYFQYLPPGTRARHRQMMRSWWLSLFAVAFSAAALAYSLWSGA